MHVQKQFIIHPSNPRMQAAFVCSYARDAVQSAADGPSVHFSPCSCKLAVQMIGMLRLLAPATPYKQTPPRIILPPRNTRTHPRTRTRPAMQQCRRDSNNKRTTSRIGWSTHMHHQHIISAHSKAVCTHAGWVCDVELTSVVRSTGGAQEEPSSKHRVCLCHSGSSRPALINKPVCIDCK